MTPDHYVWNQLFYYPMLFKTRGDALAYLFYAVGNGYFWTKFGNLSVRTETKTHPYEIITSELSRSLSNAYVSGHDCVDIYIDLWDEDRETIEAVHSTIDKRMKDYRRIFSWEQGYNPKNNSLINMIPNNIKDEWLREIHIMKVLQKNDILHS